jgi:hypothetical protein
MSDEFGLPRTLDLRALEEELRRLPDVNAARVVVDATGRPVEVHVVATTEKHPKQVVRDVLSVAQASFGLDLDRRVVSVVRLEDEGTATGPRRIMLHSVAAEQRAGRLMVRVTLEQDGRRVVGTARAGLAHSTRLRAAATAALEALAELLPVAAYGDIETAIVVQTTDRSVALVNVVFGFETREEALSGTAIVGEAGETEAVVRAVLSATNRRLAALPIPAGAARDTQRV